MGPLVCRGALWCVIHVFSQPMGGAAYVVPGCCCGQCFAFGGGNTRMPHDRFSVSLGISTFTDLKEKANRMGNMAIKAATYIAVIMVAGFDPVCCLLFRSPCVHLHPLAPALITHMARILTSI